MIFLGIDVGLSGVKAGLFRENGQAIATACSPNDAVRSNGNKSAVDMNQLWELVCQVVRKVLSAAGPGHIPSGVGLSGHGNGAYITDADGKALMGVSSMDTRAQEVVTSWHARGLDDRIAEITGGHVWAGQPLALLHSLNLPDTNGLKLMFAKDWIRYCLTGEIATDPSDASAAGLLDISSGTWAYEAFELAELPGIVPMLPDLAAESNLICGQVVKRAAERTGLTAGTPVAAGCIDFAMGAFGDGLEDDQTLHVTAGTWSINQIRTRTASNSKNSKKSKNPKTIFQTIQSPWPGEHLLIESSPTSTINLSWLAGVLGKANPDFDQWEQWVAADEKDACSPIYLPYPVGAWDMPFQRAKLAGLRLADGPEQIVRAVYEGIALGHLRQIEKYLSMDIPISRILATGGLTQSLAWCQMLSDYSQLPVDVASDPNSALRGAAIIIMQGLKLTVPHNSPARVRFVPRAERVGYGSQRFEQFKKLLNY